MFNLLLLTGLYLVILSLIVNTPQKIIDKLFVKVMLFFIGAYNIFMYFYLNGYINFN